MLPEGKLCRFMIFNKAVTDHPTGDCHYGR